MGNSNSTGGRGIGFAGALTIAFIVLKLCGVIGWSWLWVLSPLWLSMALVILVVLVIFVALLFKKRR